MFHDHLSKLLKELNIEGTVPRDMATVTLEVEGIGMDISDAPPGIELSANLGPFKETENPENLYIKLLRGNFLGQATSRAVLGLDEEGKSVLLRSSYPIIRSYREFRDAVEDFVNAVSFWKAEI